MGNKFRQLAKTEAKRHGIRPELFTSLIQAESGFNPNARSPVGAIGLGQLMPATAKGLGVDPTNPAQNLRGAAAYLKQQLNRFDGDERKALAAYNAGPGAVQKYGGIPPFKETQAYVKKVLGSAGRAGSVSPSDVRKSPSLTGSHASGNVADRSKLLRTIWGEDSPFTQLLDFQNQTNSVSIPDQSGAGGPSVPLTTDAKGPRPNLKGPDGKTYKNILSFARKNFGLDIQSENQTVGGKHSPGSFHYSGRAVDFGDANNSREQLMQLSEWARANPTKIKEFFYDPAGFYVKDGKVFDGAFGGHGDHVHIAM